MINNDRIMKVKIKDQTVELAYTMRMYILFETIQGKSVNFISEPSYTDLIVLFYCAIIATLQKNKQPLDISYDEFLDFVDEGGDKLIAEFSQWFVGCLGIQNALVPATEDEETQGKPKKAKRS